MKYFCGLSLYFISIFFAIWFIGFIVFCVYALSLQSDSLEQPDAVVVLTGGSNRIETGIQLMKQQKANYLLISGVNKQVTENDLLKNVSPTQRKKITLGYTAENTVGNAQEIDGWVKERNISSILLVTSFYHMPRSFFEISKLNKTLKIYPRPVFPKSYGDSVNWIKTRYTWLLFLEYHKFIFVRLKSLLKEVL
ncbi:MAG: YdcF family protein [Alphaproteobacteria bacterium]|nr:YdcF family protein [Alphaproteobacteria bacterium]